MINWFGKWSHFVDLLFGWLVVAEFGMPFEVDLFVKYFLAYGTLVKNLNAFIFVFSAFNQDYRLSKIISKALAQNRLLDCGEARTYISQASVRQNIELDCRLLDG